MQTEFVTTEVTRYDAAKNAFVADTKFTSVEQCFELKLNGNRFRKIFCSPNCIDDLAIGILAQAEKISSIDDVIRLDVDAKNFLIDAEVAPVEKISADDVRFSAKNILDCADENFPAEVTRPDVDDGNFNDVRFSAKDILDHTDENFHDEVTRSDVDAENFSINVETAPVKKISADELSDVRFSAKNILACADKLLGEMSTTHAKTNGVHIGLLFDGEKILLVREDIGRHNVFDKIYGAAIRERLNLRDKVLIFSGRCSSEMMLKLWRMKIPVVAAKSVPTTYSIDLARKLGITLAARMAAGSFCIYTNPQRIVLEEG